MNHDATLSVTISTVLYTVWNLAVVDYNYSARPTKLEKYFIIWLGFDWYSKAAVLSLVMYIAAPPPVI